MSAFSTGLSGLQAAEKVISAISHNVANSETPGFHKLTEHMTERGPFPVIAGVDANISRVENQLLDDSLLTATMEQEQAEILKNGVDAVEQLPEDSVSTAYSAMMDATHLLLRTPTDPIAQENFNQATESFQNSINNYADQLEQIKSDTNLQLTIQQSRVTDLQEQLQALARSGTDNPDEIYNLQMQLMQATGNVNAYRQILSDIIPPIELAFNSATDTVHTSINQLSGQEVFNQDSVNRITDFSTFNEQNLPEWDSHWFNTEMGRIQTALGWDQQDAESALNIANNNMENAQGAYNAAFGVDLVEQQVKMMEFQRMYEASAQVIKTQDEMLGTLLSIRA